MTIEKYIHFFDSNNFICLKSTGDKQFFIEKNNETPIAFFGNNEIVFKLNDGNSYFAIKLFDQIILDDNPLLINKKNYDDSVLIENKLKPDDCRIDEIIFDEKSSCKVLISPWVDGEILVNCNFPFVKQLHNLESNKAYKKFRTRVKSGVLTALTTLIFFISGVKFMYPDELFINPIDYKQLIVDDSIRTVNIALNKNKIKIAEPEIKIITKPIDIPTITDLVVVKPEIEKTETAEKNKSKTEKNKKNKNLVATSDNKNL